MVAKAGEQRGPVRRREETMEKIWQTKVTSDDCKKEVKVEALLKIGRSSSSTREVGAFIEHESSYIPSNLV